MDIKMIQKALPHRYPFLLVDRVIELNLEEQKIVALKNVTFNEHFFQGHFPEEPIMPGVLIIEALAQAGGVFAIEAFSEEERKNSRMYFMSIENAKFRRPVVPGDQLVLEVQVLKRKRNIWRLRGEAKVNEELACEVEFMAMVQQ